jgi:uncharacterized membrane-anchored protein
VELGWIPTLIILGVSAGVFLLARRIHAREADPLRPRMLDYGLVQLLAMIVVILMLVHVVTLLAGRPVTGQMTRPF